jgi:O-acetyl-ADP-ribose deacetylase
VRAVLGEVTDQAADALVRVVGPRRQSVDELGVLAAAGPQAREDFVELVRLAHGGLLPPGSALSTTGGGLLARHLVHVAVPPWSPRAEEYLLPAAYRAVLAVADDLGAGTVALTPLGMTLPYWPLDVVTRLLTGTLLHTPTRVREATLVVRTPAALEVLAAALARH